MKWFSGLFVWNIEQRQHSMTNIDYCVKFAGFLPLNLITFDFRSVKALS